MPSAHQPTPPPPPSSPPHAPPHAPAALAEPPPSPSRPWACYCSEPRPSSPPGPHPHTHTAPPTAGNTLCLALLHACPRRARSPGGRRRCRLAIATRAFAATSRTAPVAPSVTARRSAPQADRPAGPPWRGAGLAATARRDTAGRARDAAARLRARPQRRGGPRLRRGGPRPSQPECRRRAAPGPDGAPVTTPMGGAGRSGPLGLGRLKVPGPRVGPTVPQTPPAGRGRTRRGGPDSEGGSGPGESPSPPGRRPGPLAPAAHCRLCFDPIAMAERHAVGELLRALFCHSVAARPGPTDSERRGKSRGDGAHSFHLMAPFLSVAVVRKRRAKFPDPSATAAPPTASLVSTNKKLFL